MRTLYWALRAHHHGSVLHLTAEPLKHGAYFATVCNALRSGMIWPASARDVRHRNKCARCAAVMDREGSVALPESESDYAEARRAAIDALGIVRRSGGRRVAIAAEAIEEFDRALTVEIKAATSAYSDALLGLIERIDKTLERLRMQQESVEDMEARK